MKFIKVVRYLAFVLLTVFIVACSDGTNMVTATATDSVETKTVLLDVYKSPTCGCCGKWVDHAVEWGFEAQVHHPTDLLSFKADKGISLRYQSCHTAVSEEGYVFEGHIPADVISRFLKNPPANAIGLAVPGMPIGSPGMEMGNQKSSYDILLLTHEGGSMVYQHVEG